jgi:hypothetical protein
MESIPYQLSDIDKLLRELYQLKMMNQMLLNEIKRLKEDQFYDESIQPPLKNVNHFDFLPQQFPR